MGRGPDRAVAADGERQRRFRAASKAAALQQLYAAAGGTPDAVAQTYFKECEKASQAFHGKKEGEGPKGVAAYTEPTGGPVTPGQFIVAIEHPDPGS